jgi:hypothetical protein
LGTGERWSISTDGGRIRSATGGSRQSPLNDEDTGAFSSRNDPLRTSIPENMHMVEASKTQSGCSLNTKHRHQQARCAVRLRH